MSYWTDREQKNRLRMKQKEIDLKEREAKLEARRKNGGAGFSVTLYDVCRKRKR